MNNIKKEEELSIQLKLREIDRAYDEIDKEDRNFKEITLGLFTLMGVIYGFILTNYNNEELKYIIDFLIIVLTPSLASGVVISAVASIVKQNSIKKYIQYIKNSLNFSLSMNYKITSFTDWNSKKGYGGKQELLYVWNLIIPVTTICLMLIVNVILRFDISNTFNKILIVCFIFIFITTIFLIILMAVKNNKICNK